MRKCHLEDRENVCCCECMYVQTCTVSCLDKGATYTCKECDYTGLEFDDSE